MADKPDKPIDCFDVPCLEASLNDSATRVSTIWVSFLVFGLYLLTAAATVTHRQLLLAEPIKLPVLNIDLPLWGFFFLAPILFVTLHAYVLLQVILLARTAAAYNEAVRRVVERDRLPVEASASLRQRLANTLFAQMFAGTEREREGGFGWLLRAMAWITLAISPVLILLAFQFMFLPYHSHLATWTHRLLILLEFVLAFRLWPMVLDSTRDFHLPRWRGRASGLASRLRGRRTAEANTPDAAWALRRPALGLGAGLSFIVLSLWLASFPGEPHVNLLTARPFDAVQCERWVHREWDRFDLRLDRLILPAVDAVDDDKLKKIVEATAEREWLAFQGERTRDLRGRDLTCSDLTGADLRRVDLTAAQLSGAILWHAALDGAVLTGARLHGAVLASAPLRGASLARAQLQGVSLDYAQLQGAVLIETELQGASLNDAELAGAVLDGARLQGASLLEASLQGASLVFADLRGAALDRAQFQGASLRRARLQGASLSGAQLQGALLNGAQLQGTLWRGAGLDTAVLSDVKAWRAGDVDCASARVRNAHLDAAVSVPPGRDEPRVISSSREGAMPAIGASPQEIEAFIAASLAQVPDGAARERAARRMREGLGARHDGETAALADAWRRCETESRKVSQPDFADRQIAVLRAIVCDAERDVAAIAAGFMRVHIAQSEGAPEFVAKLARALLGTDGKACAGAQHYSAETTGVLRRAAAAGPVAAGAAPK